jgi:type IX secretion system substrate protein
LPPAQRSGESIFRSIHDTSRSEAKVNFFRRLLLACLSLPLLALVFPSETFAWAPDGTPVGTGPGRQLQPQLVAANDGGAFIAWTDFTPYVVLAQKLGPGGALEWDKLGVPVAPVGGGAQYLPQLVSDDQGGVIIAWRQFDPNSPHGSLYAQRFTAKGQRLWGDRGVRVGPSAGIAFSLAGDGAGGAFVVSDTAVFDTGHGGYAPRLLIQHVGEQGQLVWPAGALPVSEAPGQQYEPNAVPDGQGGAIVAWADDRNLVPGQDYSNSDIFTQRFAGDGSRLWLPTGTPVCLNQAQQGGLAIIAGPSGGVDLAWQDARNWPPFPYQIYAQSLDENGQPRWARDGVLVSPVYGEQIGPKLTDDGANGIIVVWNDIWAFAQHLDASGSPLWQVGGITLSQRSGVGKIVSDGEGGAVILLTGTEVVVQHVSADGALLQEEVLTQTGQVYYGGSDALTSAKNQYIAAWTDAPSGPDEADVYAGRFKPSPGHAPPLAIREVETPQRATGDLSLKVSPNPARGPFTISATAAEGPPARLSVFDTRGRLVMSQPVGTGAMSMTVGARVRFEPGIYLVVVEQGNARTVQRVCLLH